MDWPPARHRCYPKKGTVFSYRCRVYSIWWQRGSGYGRTAQEAATRAVAQLERNRARWAGEPVEWSP